MSKGLTKKPLGEFRRFKYITENQEKRDKLNSLISEKNLSREDLMLVLETIDLDIEVVIQLNSFPNQKEKNYWKNLTPAVAKTRKEGEMKRNFWDYFPLIISVIALVVSLLK